MNKFFKILLLSFYIFVSLPFFKTVYAQEPTVKISNSTVEVVVFLRVGCSHCAKQKVFLDKIEKERRDIKITRYNLELTRDREIWNNFTNKAGISKVTPITVVGNSYIIGYDSDATTGKEILELIDRAREKGIETNLDKATNAAGSQNASCDSEGLEPCVDEKTYYVNLPFFGRIDALTYPLLSLAVILGFIDGFNPCAMWVLVTFLVILMQVGDRRKMFWFAGTFIAAEAIMYTLILTVWYKTWDFVQLDNIVTPLIGIVSIIGGLFFLKEWRRKELECKVTNVEQKRKTTQKIQSLASSKFTFVTFLSILGIAFSVNIIEFACSIGIPQAFTKILELNNLSIIQTAFYIGTYILFYMVDDFIVFGLALYSMDKLAMTAKYTRYSNMIGGIIMIILGLILIFKPSFLMFY